MENHLTEISFTLIYHLVKMKLDLLVERTHQTLYYTL